MFSRFATTHAFASRAAAGMAVATFGERDSLERMDRADRDERHDRASRSRRETITKTGG